MTSQHALSLYLVLLAILQVMAPHSCEAADSRTRRSYSGHQDSSNPHTSPTKEYKPRNKLENAFHSVSELLNYENFSRIYEDNISISDNQQYVLPVKHGESGTNESSSNVKFNPVSFIMPQSEDAIDTSLTMRHWKSEVESLKKKPSIAIKSVLNYLHNSKRKSEDLFSEKILVLKGNTTKNRDGGDAVLNNKRVRRSITWNSTQDERCARFSDPQSNPTNTIYTLYSPGDADSNYTKNIECEIVLEADRGYLLELDFRNSFFIELSENCTYDYLQVRDGAHGFSKELGRYCGSKFPPPLRSTGRHLWLHFSSDDNIEYSGFTAVIKMVDRPTDGTLPPESNDCWAQMEGDEGLVQSSTVPAEFLEFAQKHRTHIDCLWKITVRPDWRIRLQFTKFDLKAPNERNKNYVDVFDQDTSNRIANFCGSIAESVASSPSSNLLFVHYYADYSVLNSTWEVLYTAYRDQKEPIKSCVEDEEFDCEDATCIAMSLRCNGQNNCRHKNDENAELCKSKQSSPLATTHVIVIVVVFAFILSGMSFVFVFKCVRKLMSDHKLIDEHLRQSREDRLEEIGVCEAAELAKRARAESLASLTSAAANVNNNNTGHNNRRNESLDRRRRHLTSCEDSREGGDSERMLHGERMDFERSQRAERPKRTDNMERLEHSDRMDHRKERVDISDRVVRANQMDQRSQEIRSDHRDRRQEPSRSNHVRMDRMDHSVQIDDEFRSSRDQSPDMRDEECQTRESQFVKPRLVPSNGTSFGNSEGSGSSGAGAFSTFGYGGRGGLEGAGRAGCSASTLRRVESPPAPSPAPRAYRAEAVVRLEAATPADNHKEDSRPVSCTTTRSAPDVIIVTKLPGH